MCRWQAAGELGAMIEVLTRHEVLNISDTLYGSATLLMHTRYSAALKKIGSPSHHWAIIGQEAIDFDFGDSVSDGESTVITDLENFRSPAYWSSWKNR